MGSSLSQINCRRHSAPTRACWRKFRKGKPNGRRESAVDPVPSVTFQDSLAHDGAKCAVPIGTGGMGFKPRNARKLQVVHFLAGAGELAALVDQLARLLPLLRAQ